MFFLNVSAGFFNITFPMVLEFLFEAGESCKSHIFVFVGRSIRIENQGQKLERLKNNYPTTVSSLGLRSARDRHLRQLEKNITGPLCCVHLKI